MTFTPNTCQMPTPAYCDAAITWCRFSVSERKNPAPSRREIEISKVIREALEPAVMLEKFPRTAVDVYMEILQADGGTRLCCT